MSGSDAQYQAVVTELRRMRDNDPTGELKQLAVAVYRLSEQLKAGKELCCQKR